MIKPTRQSIPRPWGNYGVISFQVNQIASAGFPGYSSSMDLVSMLYELKAWYYD